MALMNAKADTLEGNELDVLGTFVEVYESKNFAIDKPNPVEVIRFCMEQYGLKDKDLVPFFGHSGRVSEVLNYSRKLTLTMIRKLHKAVLTSCILVNERLPTTGSILEKKPASKPPMLHNLFTIILMWNCLFQC